MKIVVNDEHESMSVFSLVGIHDIITLIHPITLIYGHEL